MIRKILIYAIQITALCYNIYSISKVKRKSMLLNMSVANGLNLCVYLVSQTYDGLITSMHVTIRSFLYAHKEKFRTNLIFWICTLSQAALSMITFKSWLSILPVTASLLVCYVTWFFETQQIRKWLVLSDALWFIFNIANGLFIQAVTIFIAMCSKIYFVIKYRKSAKKENIDDSAD